MALLNELEITLNRIDENLKQIQVIDSPEEGQIVLMKDENGIYEEYLVGEAVVEEPVTETPPVKKPVAKKPTVKKTAPKK
jgi:hypothetical protein